MQNHLSHEYLAQNVQDLLQAHQLASFQQLWDYQGEWFETPNEKRGGWSGVNYIVLRDEVGQTHGFYLKRQENYTRKTWRQPFKGEPTYVREYEMMQFLASTEVSIPKLVYFAQNENRSILMTAALAGYQSADHWMSENSHLPIKQKKMAIVAMASTVRAMHKVGLQHRSLYLKHLFIKNSNDKGSPYEVAVIDFEKSRVTRWIWFYRFMDLMKLWQRSHVLTRKFKLHFFKSYLNIKRLTFFDKTLFHCIDR